MMREVPGIIRECRTIKLDSIKNNTCQFSLYKCLPGPQTIEKAKQASLVAMDLRKRIDGDWGKIEGENVEKNMHFIHVIAEFSHWERKSQAVITKLIDQNVIVPDAIMIRAFKIFEEAFGADRMLDRIKKKEFMRTGTNGEKVRESLSKVFEEFENHIFYDFKAKTYVEFGYDNGKLITKKI